MDKLGASPPYHHIASILYKTHLAPLKTVQDAADKGGIRQHTNAGHTPSPDLTLWLNNSYIHNEKGLVLTDRIHTPIDADW